MPTLLRVVTTLVLESALLAGPVLAQTPPALKIVVIKGEDAVNIIQQKTAVGPLVEVRDRNNLPVPGAVVTFTLSGGQHAAFAGGLQALTVTTNAAGQAAATGLTPMATGAFQIQVQAAFQGQVATAAISQTNFATAAAAAQAGHTAGAATGAGAGGGGGMSGTTMAIIGAAAAGGAAVAVTAANNSNSTGSAPAQPSSFTGPFSGQIVVTTTTASAGGTSTCVSTRAISGTMTITLQGSGGAPSNTAVTTGSQTEVSVTSSPFCSPLATTPFNWSAPLTVSGSDLSFSSQTSSSGPTPGGTGSVTATSSLGFKGSLSGGVITGNLSYLHETRGTNDFQGVLSTISGNGSTTMPVTLR